MRERLSFDAVKRISSCLESCQQRMTGLTSLRTRQLKGAMRLKGPREKAVT